MNNSVLEAKNEIIKWVGNLHDLEVIQQLLDLKNQNNSTAQVSEPEAEYAVKDDFDERFEKGISGEELLKSVFAHIDSLPWKE